MYIDSEVPSRLERQRRGQVRKWIRFPKFSIFRLLMLGSVLLGIVVGFALWPTVEARSSMIALHSQAEMSRWLSEQFTRRETVISFRYEGDTKSLTKMAGQSLSAALYSDPFIRYNVSRYSYQWKGSTDSAVVNVYVDYRETYEQSQYVRQQAKEIVSRITNAGQSPHVKVKAIHDYIVSHVAYDESMTKFTAYEALTEGTTVCQGYALLMQAMLEEANIPSKIVEGKAGGLLHAWNLIELDGQWYHVDATWDDPLPDRGKLVRYTYYMRTDAEMRTDHDWNESAELPKADVPYERALEQMHQGTDQGMRSFVKELERGWSPDVLLPEREVKNVSDLVERYQSAQKVRREQFQVRYTGSELQLRADLHDMMDKLGLSTPFEYRVSVLNNSDDLLVDIELQK